MIVGNNFANHHWPGRQRQPQFGLGGNDNMFGGIGNDLLNGGIGADTMRGELGNDTFIIDNGGDVVIDFGAGIDRIVSSINTSLSLAGRLTVENLTSSGPADSESRIAVPPSRWSKSVPGVSATPCSSSNASHQDSESGCGPS